MAQDRFIHWTSKSPSRNEIGTTLRAFFGQGVASIAWDKDRFFIELHGASSTLTPSVPVAEGRWIEVWYDSDCLDVITRQADPYTSTLAEGLVVQLAHYWKARLEDEDG